MYQFAVRSLGVYCALTYRALRTEKLRTEFPIFVPAGNFTFSQQNTFTAMSQSVDSSVQVSTPEKELLAVAQNGDVLALGRLYDAYAPPLLGFIFRITKDQEKAEEILQATFLEVFGRIRDYDPSAEKLFPWMLRIARAQTVHSANVPNNATNGEIRNEADLVNCSSVESADHSTLIDLLYVQGHSFARISQELGLSVETLKTRIRKELKQYRQGPRHA